MQDLISYKASDIGINSGQKEAEFELPDFKELAGMDLLLKRVEAAEEDRARLDKELSKMKDVMEEASEERDALREKV